MPYRRLHVREHVAEPPKSEGVFFLERIGRACRRRRRRGRRGSGSGCGGHGQPEEVYVPRERVALGNVRGAHVQHRVQAHVEDGRLMGGNGGNISLI